jgi:hypothetical protein
MSKKPIRRRPRGKLALAPTPPPEQSQPPEFAALELTCECHKQLQCSSPPIRILFDTRMFGIGHSIWRDQHRLSVLRGISALYEAKYEEIRQALMARGDVADLPPLETRGVTIIDTSALLTKETDHDH